MLRLTGIACMLAAAVASSAALAQSLVERLGFEASDKVLIINCDDFGMCRAENAATFEALTDGVATSATVMIPCPWLPDVVTWKREHPDASLGIHLTLTSEWTRYRWPPVLGRELVPSLVDEQGYMWKDCEPLWEHADADQVYRECRAQVQRAIALGLDPTHLDNHMGSLQTSPELWRVYLRLAKEFDLPVRMVQEEVYAMLGAGGRRKEYEAAGILGPDVLVYAPAIAVTLPKNPGDVPRYYEEILRGLKPGTVTEIYLHAALDGPELQHISSRHAFRQADRDWLVAPETRKLIDELGIKLISYRPIRELQRKARGR